MKTMWEEIVDGDTYVIITHVSVRTNGWPERAKRILCAQNNRRVYQLDAAWFHATRETFILHSMCGYLDPVHELYFSVNI